MPLPDGHPMVDLGLGWRFCWVTDGAGVRVGIIVAHPDNEGERCESSVIFDRGWSLISAEPLTLEPSISCTACGAHGWIRDGRWHPV